MLRLLVILALACLSGCAARSSGNYHPCAETDGCWQLMHSPAGFWAWCRQEDNVLRCIPQRGTLDEIAHQFREHHGADHQVAPTTTLLFVLLLCALPAW